MKNNRILEILTLIFRLYVGCVFIFYSLDKISSPAIFSKSIMNYDILPIFLINIFALILPWVELISGFMLIFGIKQKAMSFLIGFMTLIFIIAITSALVRGLNINCGCSNNFGEIVGLKKILEDTVILVCCAFIYFFPSKRFNFNIYAAV